MGIGERNMFIKTSFANSGRSAGMGIFHDNYDDESTPEVGDRWDGGKVRVIMPSRTKEERVALDGPVIITKLK